jgi:hypothetical protein
MTANIEVVISEEVATKTFGSDVAPAIEAYKQALTEARHVQEAAQASINHKLRVASKAVRELLGVYSTEAEAFTNMLSSLTEKDRRERKEAVDSVYEMAVATAQTAKEAAISLDPFTKFVTGYLTRRYGHSYADTFTQAMPLTYEGLRQLAHDNGWCSDYESVMGRAVTEGALPKEDVVTLRKPVEVDNVPSSYGAREGEKWVRVVTIPAYVRFNDSSGRMRQPDALRQYFLTDTYVKADSKTEDTTPAES